MASNGDRQENRIVRGGALGELIRSYHWDGNVLGPIHQWPTSLVVSVNTILQSPVPLVLLWGTEGIMIYNDAYSIFAGQRHPFLLGSKVLEGWPEVADFNQNVLREIWKGKTLSYSNQRLTLYRNNVAEEVWMNLNYSAILDEKGQPAGIMAIVFETTQGVIAEKERKKIEVELRESRENFVALMTATSDVIYSMNADWSEMGLLEGRVFVPDVGKPRNDWFESNVPGSDQPLVRRAIEEAIKTKTIFQLEHRIKRADGTIGWIFSRAIPILGGDNEVLKWFGAASDITERKNAEEALQEKNKLLERTNSDLDNFIYTASHDLKAPVSNIEGLVNSLADILESEQINLNEETNAHLQMIRFSVTKFKNTINDLTEISKVQKLLQEDIEEINIEEVFEDVKLSMLDKITETNARIIHDFSEVSTFKYSRKNIRSILYNLLSNSVKYKDPVRKPEISVVLKNVLDWTLLQVTDNGLGINTEDQKKVFSIYKRFHSHVEGTGIGLYIVKKIVDNSGGYIELKSEVGVGTSFQLYFKK